MKILLFCSIYAIISLAHAEDGCEISLSSLSPKEDGAEVSVIITNNSAQPIKLVPSLQVYVIRESTDPSDISPFSIKVQHDILQPCIFLRVPKGFHIFFPSNGGRILSVKTLEPGKSLQLSRVIALNPAITFDQLSKASFHIIAFMVGIPGAVTGKYEDADKILFSSPIYTITSDSEHRLKSNSLP